MACIPAAIALLSVAAIAVLGLIHASARWDWGTYKLWPRNTPPEVAAATIANAKTRRYFWIPGFHVFVCRTTLFNKDNTADIEAHRRVQHAVNDALDTAP